MLLFYIFIIYFYKMYVRLSFLLVFYIILGNVYYYKKN